MDLIVIYVVVLALLAGVPIIFNVWFNVWLSYRLAENKERYVLMGKLVEKASDGNDNKLELKELQEFLAASREPSSGIPGLARSTMTLTVIVILGIAVFHILAVGIVGDTSQNINPQIINNILSMLAGLLAAITGFYFGGKGTTGKQSQ